MDRHPSDRGSSRHASGRRVALFIDFDNLRGGLEDQQSTIALTDIPKPLIGLAQQDGRTVIAAAYGDWTAAPEAAQEFRRCSIETRLVLGQDGDEGQSELALALDAQELLYREPNIDEFILVTGYHDLHELIQRLRRADRRTMLVAQETAVAAEYRSADRFMPLEEALGSHGDTYQEIDFSNFDWKPFIDLVDDLEHNMPFVGFGWLLKKRLNHEIAGCGSLQGKQQLMDRAVDDGIVTLYKVDNIDHGGDPVTACKLNRDNTIVKDCFST